MKRKNILVIGSVNMDLILETDRLPLPSESYVGTVYRYLPGGKGANQAVAAARMGASVSFLGRVGADENGRTLRQGLEGFGVNTALLSRDGERPTGLAVILLEEGARNRILVYPGANDGLSPAHAEQALASGRFDGVILQLEIPPETVIAAVRGANAAKIPVILDAGPAQAFPLEELGGLEFLSPNETETAALCGVTPGTPEELRECAAILSRRAGAKHVVLKLGGRGAYAYSGGQGKLFPAFPVDAVDPTAAGDAFTAAMAVEYLESRSLGKAVRFANAAGALAATVLGAQPSIPSREQTAEFLESHTGCEK